MKLVLFTKNAITNTPIKVQPVQDYMNESEEVVMEEIYYPGYKGACLGKNLGVIEGCEILLPADVIESILLENNVPYEVINNP